MTKESQTKIEGNEGKYVNLKDANICVMKNMSGVHVVFVRECKFTSRDH